MQYKPHDYQEYAKNFILEHPASGLLLDCGLGKTVITLSALWELVLDYFLIGKVLIIAPIRVGRDTWPAEIEKWDHLKGLSYSVVIGTEKERRAALMKPAFLYIINRENVAWLVDNKLFDFDCVVIDELSSFKNWQSKRFRALRKVRARVKYVIGLTGSPAPNGLIDLWAQVNLLDMGERLGRYIGGYRERYFLPDKRSRDVIFSYKPKEGAEDAIYEAISDICVSMKANDYLQMPDLIESNVMVEMDEKERKIYDQLKADLIVPFPDGDIDAASAVGLSNKLLQMANGACYDENGKVRAIHARKLDALEDLIEAANGKPMLVAYWFKHDLEQITKRLEQLKVEYARIDSPGSIEMWNRGEFAVGLIHPASAGHGLNLQEGGCHLVWYSQSWSLELTQQCNARLYRQGQKYPVTIQHIICKDTIDEDVIRALESKNSKQETMLAAVKARIGGAS